MRLAVVAWGAVSSFHPLEQLGVPTELGCYRLDTLEGPSVLADLA